MLYETPHQFEMNTAQRTSPSWDEILQNIGKHLYLRRGLLAKRTLAVTAPGLVALFFVELFSRIARPYLGFIEEVAIPWFFYGTLYLVVTIIVVVILLAIAKIEQAVWIVSYADGRNLTPQESWRIARRLYWRWTDLQVQAFKRYYLWVVLALCALIIAIGYGVVLGGVVLSSNTVAMVVPLLTIGVGLALVLWTRYLKIRLSYAPFLFLVRYQPAVEHPGRFWHEFFQDLKRLDDASRGDSFHKNVLLELGADMAMTVVEYVATRMNVGFQSAVAFVPGIGGAIMGALGFTTVRAGTEVAHRVILFSKLVGRFVLYRYAYRNVHSAFPPANEYLYRLKG